MTVTIQTRNVYGNEAHYPICDAAFYFAQIAGTKTLTLQTIKLIQLLGYQITQKPTVRTF